CTTAYRILGTLPIPRIAAYALAASRLAAAAATAAENARAVACSTSRRPSMNCRDCWQTDTAAETTMPVPTAVSTTAISRRLNDRRLMDFWSGGRRIDE